MGTDLREAVAVDAPTIEQLHERVSVRARRRRVRRVTAFVVIVALVGGVVAMRQSDSSQRVTAGQPTSTTTPVVAAPPLGDRFVDYGFVRIAVPNDWQVVGVGSSITTPCSGHGWIAQEQATISIFGCTTPDAVVRIETLPTGTAGGTSTTPELHNGIEVFQVGDPASPNRYEIPSLDAVLTFTDGADPGSILPTLAPSARYLALQEPVAPGGDWQRVTYGGLAFRVPAGWPLVDVQRDAAVNSGRIPIFTCGQPEAPEVDLGVGINPSCPVVPPGPPADGVHAYSQDSIAEVQAGSVSMMVADLSVTIGPDAGGGTLGVTVTAPNLVPLTFVIGLGPDGHVAGAILRSISRA
jgi:hypothetical protein